MAKRSAEVSLAEIAESNEALRIGAASPLWAPATNYLFQYLATSAGSVELAVDADPDPVTFSVEIPDGVDLLWARTNLYVVDNAKEEIIGFFTIAALSNGLFVAVRDAGGNLVQDFGTTDHPIKRHMQFASLAGTDVGVDSVTAEGQSRHSVRWTVARTGASMRVPGGHSIEIVIQDDISALLEFRAMIQGVLIPSSTP